MLEDVEVLCTEAEIQLFVHDFYGRIRQDSVLGPIFNHHIKDWAEHLEKLVDFWVSILLGTRRFHGTPMPKHTALPDLSASLFERWLTLFRATLADQPNGLMAERAYVLAQRVARSLWLGYQMHHCPGVLPRELMVDPV